MKSNLTNYIVRGALVATCFSLMLGTLSFFSSKKNDIPLGAEYDSIELALEEATPILSNNLASRGLLLPWSEIIVKKGDNLGYLFKKLDLSANQLQALLTLPESKWLKKIHPGDVLSVQVLDDTLHALRYSISDDQTLVMEYQPHTHVFESQIIQHEAEVVQTYRQATIRESLFAAGKKAGLTDKLIMELAGIFAWDIDFALDLQPGDSFEVLFEEKYVDGQQSSTGHILAATFTNQGKTYSAVRFTTSDGHTNYYTDEGLSLHTAFLRTPVNFSRISSHFDLSRKHPVLHNIRAHKGVDYAAPHGTPVKATGDAKITFIGHKGGYGKVLELQHGPKYSTLYAHLSNFSKGLKVGSNVIQGQTIGYVGSSGLATGPHLHYEFRIDGVHHNPITVALPQAAPIVGADKQKFLAHAEALLTNMEQQQTVMVASTTFKRKE